MSTELDQALERIKAKVAERRAAGEYPPGFEEALDAPFEQLVGAGRASLQIDVALAVLQAVPPFSLDLIPTTSRLPGGSVVHATTSRLVGRQTAGILQQIERYRHAMDQVVAALAGRSELPPASDPPWTSDRIDNLLDRLAVLEQIGARLDDLSERVASIEDRLAAGAGPD